MGDVLVYSVQPVRIAAIADLVVGVGSLHAVFKWMLPSEISPFLPSLMLAGSWESAQLLQAVLLGVHLRAPVEYCLTRVGAEHVDGGNPVATDLHIITLL